MPKQRREYYRLEYPLFFRPTLFFGDKKFDVLDVSECGVKFHAKDINSFMIGEKLDANLIFKDEDTHTCEGKIIRVDPNEVIVNLATPIPLHKIRSEHIFLIQNGQYRVAN